MDEVPNSLWLVLYTRNTKQISCCCGIDLTTSLTLAEPPWSRDKFLLPWETKQSL